jgi:hypothetical protein
MKRLSEKAFLKKFMGAPYDNHELAEAACSALTEASGLRRAAREYLEAEERFTTLLEEKGFEFG